MQIGLGLSLTIPRVGGFSPAVLFANSEPGAWYDPSDLSTMFQDRAGTTPVTATGQSVGLVLDKSRGLVLGSQKDPGFANYTGVLTGTWAVSGGNYVFTDTVGGQSRPGVQWPDVGDAAPLPAGWYQITVVVASVTGATQVRLDGVGATDRLLVVGTNTFIANVTTLSRPRFRIEDLSTTIGDGFALTSVSVREIPGNHMTAVSDAARGTYNVDENGKAFILFDGADDGYLTSTITPGTDKAQVFAGVRVNAETAGLTQVLAEISTNAGANNGTFELAAMASDGNNKVGDNRFRSRGTTIQAALNSTLTSPPRIGVVAGLGDISGGLATLRVDGVQVAQSASDQGTGNYLAYPLYIGRRGGTMLPFNGRLYSLIVRFGPNLDAATIGQVEQFVAGRTGVTL
jgi:hypothetical protein